MTQQDLGIFNKREINRVAAGLKSSISSDPNCKFSLDYHPPADSEFTAGAHWTVTASSEAKALSVTMIVRGSPWWTVNKLWFTKDGSEYVCDEDTFREIPAFRALETLLTDKANELGQERDRQDEANRANRRQARESELKRADNLINSLEQEKTHLRRGRRGGSPERD